MVEGRCLCRAVRVRALETGYYEAHGLAVVHEPQWSGPVQVSSGAGWRLCELCGTTLGKESILCPGTVPELALSVELLHEAAEAGDLAEVQELVRRGAPIDARLDDSTPWMLARSKGHGQVCDFLREQGARPPRVVLGTGTGRCDCGGVRFQIHSGLVVEVAPETSLERPERYLYMPLERFEVLKGQRLLQEARGSKEVRRDVCRRCRATVCLRSPDNPHLAYVPLKRFDDPQAALRICPAGPEVHEVVEAEALHDAVRRNDKVQVEELLSAGVPVDAQVGRNIPLECAVWDGNLELIALLLECGADVHQVRFVSDATRNYSAVLKLLVKYGKSLQNFLANEVRSGSIATVRKLLRAGADLNLPDDDRGDWVMPLHWSAHHSCAMIRFVIANGADVRVLSHGGGHALGACALWGKTRRLRTLLECGFPVNLEQGRPGDTALFESCWHGRVGCVKTLLEYGADPNLAFHERTPLMVASRHGSLAIVEMLLEHGADPTRQDNEGLTAADYARRAQPHLLEQTRSFARGRNSAGEVTLYDKIDSSREPVWTLGHRAILARLEASGSRQDLEGLSGFPGG